MNATTQTIDNDTLRKILIEMPIRPQVRKAILGTNVRRIAPNAWVLATEPMIFRDLSRTIAALVLTLTPTHRYYLAGKRISESQARQAIISQLQSLPAGEMFDRVNWYMEKLHKCGWLWAGEPLECR